MCIPYTRINFDKWRILSTLDKSWQDSELVHAISGEAALLVKEGGLYFVGKWGNIAVSGKQIMKLGLESKVCCIASGKDYAVILCTNGFVSTIETSNIFSQIGVLSGKRINKSGMSLIHPDIPGIIVDICCGHKFILALDNLGMVWCWGTFFNIWYSNPHYLKTTKIIEIAADVNQAAALDQSGKVYYWRTSEKPEELAVVAQQIVCCFGDLYILTMESTLYIYSELTEIDLNFKINYIASNSDKMVVRSTNGMLFILNRIDGTFQQAKSTNILECFANSKMPGVVSHTTKEIESASGSEEKNILLKNIALLYNSKNFSDVDIILSDGTLHAHKCILAARSELFNKLLTSPESNVLNFSNASPNVMQSYVNYIYSGSLPKIDKFDHLLELHDMAKDDSNNLSANCIKLCRSLINEENALAYYVASATFNNTVLMRDCAEVVVKNTEKNVTELFRSLNTEEVRKLFQYGAKSDK